MQAITLNPPNSQDGYAVYRLIERCPPLDTNSSYCNLLQCSHFSDTSVVAKMADQVVGFISGYLKPGQPDTLFIWQVAVGNEARGNGLAKDMLLNLLDRDACAQVTHLETTVTADNAASWALFESLTRDLDTTLTRSVLFDSEQHFGGQHASELLARIGPFEHASNRKDCA